MSIAASHGVAPGAASARQQRPTGGGAVRGGDQLVGGRPVGRSVGRCRGYRLAAGADQFIGERIATTAPFCTRLLAPASPGARDGATDFALGGGRFPEKGPK